MNDQRPGRPLIPRPRMAARPSRRSSLRKVIGPWLPLIGSTLAVAIALFSLPSVLAMDLESDASKPVGRAFPVTVYPDQKAIVEDPEVEALLSEAPSELTAAAGLGDLIFTWVAVRISELSVYRQLAGIAGIDTLFVTIYPGYRAEEVAGAFGNKLGWSSTKRATFLKAVRAKDPKLPDGQFVPGTYFVSVTDPEDAADMVFERFNTEILARYGTSTAEQVPLKDAVTIASLLEREAGGWEDMRLISGVIWNRLFLGMPLQIDATMQYSKATLAGGKGGWWPSPIPADKNIRHPYNTYRRVGLPPGPIANPSIAAVLAALNPKKTDCLFYFHDRYGRFHCSKTYEGHVSLLRKYYGQGR